MYHLDPPRFGLVIIPLSIRFVTHHSALLHPDFFLQCLGASVDCFDVRHPLGNVSSANFGQNVKAHSIKDYGKLHVCKPVFHTNV